MKLNKNIGIIFILLTPLFIIFSYFISRVEIFLSSLLIGIASSSIVIIIQMYTNYHAEFKEKVSSILHRIFDLEILIQTLAEIPLDSIWSEPEEYKSEINNFGREINELKFEIDSLVYWYNSKIKRDFIKYKEYLNNLEETLGLDMAYLKEQNSLDDSMLILLNLTKLMTSVKNEEIIDLVFHTSYSLGIDVFKNETSDTKDKIIKKKLSCPKELYLRKIKRQYFDEAEYFQKKCKDKTSKKVKYFTE